MEDRKVLIQAFMKKQLLTTTILITIVIIGRVVPHLPNFTPLAAVALFGGVYLEKKYAIILPLVTLFISDVLLGFHNTMLYVYSSMILVTMLGILARKKKSITSITAATLGGSLLFFLITNFGVWVQGSLYPLTPQGLFESYYMGLPFFKNSLLGNAFYVVVLFGGYEIALQKTKQHKFVQKFLKI